MIRRLLWRLLGPVPSGYQPDARPALPRPETCAATGPHVMTPIRVQHQPVVNPVSGQAIPHTVVLSRCACGGLTTGILAGTWTLEDVLDKPAGAVAQSLIDSTQHPNPGRNP